MNRAFRKYVSILSIVLLFFVFTNSVFATTTNVVNTNNNTVMQQNQNTNTNIDKNDTLIQPQQNKQVLPEKQKGELLKMKELNRTELEKYQAQYKNNKFYGYVAYILNIARILSIPFFVLGILISVVYQFMIGLKKRDMVNRGRGMRITFVIGFIIFQVLPLLFAIVIKFWGN